MIAKLLENTSLNAKDHQSFIEATIHYNNKTTDNVFPFIGDNCTVNCEMSNDTVIPLIGFSSHHFNLAADQWIKYNLEYAEITQKMNACTIQLQQLTNAALL